MRYDYPSDVPPTRTMRRLIAALTDTTTTTTTTTPEGTEMYRTKFHRDGTVTVWDVYTQSWMRTARPSDSILASLPSDERDRVIRHCGIR